MRGSLLVLVALTGCDSLFGLEREYEIDAPLPGDQCWSATEPGNEDLDGFADGCDPCPADPDAAINDTDGDTVGDFCDPDVQTADSRIIAFDGFTDTTDWMTTGGTWVTAKSEYRQTLATGTATAEVTIPVAVYPAIDVRFRNPVACDLCGPGAYVVLGTRRVGCMYEYRDGTDQISITLDGATVQTKTPMPEGSPDRLVVRVLPGNMIQCRAYSGGRQTAELVSTSIPWAMTTARVGLITRSALATYDSITVLGSPP